MGDAYLVRRGGGGSDLSLKVVGGITQPVDGKENTLWVNTGVPITNWAFRITEPTSAEEGMVWFATTNSNEVSFNALKKNELYVYPFEAKQLQGGAWIRVPFHLYQNGAWVSPSSDIIIFFEGVENTGVTGGWSSTGTVTNDGANLVFLGKDILAATKQKIDLSNFSSLVFEAGNAAGADAYVGYGLTQKAFTARAKVPQYNSVIKQYTLDLSGVTSNEGHYLIVNSVSASNALTISKIALIM